MAAMAASAIGGSKRSTQSSTIESATCPTIRQV
jgi:hypothetical protein